ncbi:MAG: hypothetical protein GY821_10195 [Gammaproteobacteria bacterium]|nr:hypothetical protein [Gammaproteobacteria bacterium]MCP4474914.1 hypothetical protein [Gammaproteobacteria bacterium]
MMVNPTTLVLMGFKGVGKSAVAKQLAAKLQRPFIDLDKQIEAQYVEQFHQSLSYRQIMAQHGADVFHTLEHEALRQAILCRDSVLALGGRTPLAADNQALLSSAANPCLLIYLQAPAAEVFARIMANGRPAFFPAHEDPQQTFERLWQARIPIYQQLADITIDNSGSVMQSVEKILQQLSQCGGQQ